MNKPPLTYEAQLQLLKDRGLTAQDDTDALHCLANYNYYRLSSYWRCFTDSADHDRFTPGTTFEQVWQLYHFDRELRKLVNEACKQLEISARSRWAYELGQAYGCQAYEDPAVFSHVPAHTKLLAWFDDRFEQSKELFVEHYKAKPCHRPEIWIAIELLDFGKFCRFYNTTKKAQLRKRIAHHYALDESSFSSLLMHCNYLRNTCAHHSRLWNRCFTIKLSIPKKKPLPLVATVEHFPKAEEIESRKLYNSLVLMIHCLKTIEPRGDWPQRLVAHLQTLPANLIPDMGFPSDWQTRPIWSAVLGTNK